MSNSLIGKEFTLNGNNTIILDDVIINKIDDWKVYITVSTTIGNIGFSIIDFNIYHNRSAEKLDEYKVKNLLPIVFNELANFKEFKGAMAHDLMEYKTRFSIYVTTMDMD